MYHSFTPQKMVNLGEYENHVDIIVPAASLELKISLTVQMRNCASI